ncbi:hypothetical protein STEG23_006160, partial [Scotinomys teguina]
LLSPETLSSWYQITLPRTGQSLQGVFSEIVLENCLSLSAADLDPYEWNTIDTSYSIVKTPNTAVDTCISAASCTLSMYVMPQCAFDSWTSKSCVRMIHCWSKLHLHTLTSELFLAVCTVTFVKHWRKLEVLPNECNMKQKTEEFSVPIWFFHTVSDYFLDVFCLDFFKKKCNIFFDQGTGN